MGFLEQAITELNQIQTVSRLESYLTQLCAQLPHVQWCSLIVQSCDLAYIGMAPEDVKQTLTLSNLKRINAQSCKPVWAVAETATKKMPIPLNSLLIPIAAVKPECAWLTLGLSGKVSQSEVAEKLGWYWHIIATYIYDTYRRLTLSDDSQSVQLTPREIECTHWAAQGKTSWEISIILGISERTVNFHLTNSMQKTGSINRQQLVRNSMNFM